MAKKHFTIVVLILCLGLIMMGCPKKTLVKEEPSTMKTEGSTADREKTARLEKEQKAKEKELTLEKERAAKLEAERALKEKELESKTEEAKRVEAEKFEKSLVAKKYPGIEGEVFETNLLKDIHFDFDKYDIRPEDSEILKGNSALLMKFPNVKMQIEGHCDERGTVEYNLALGERRANSAKKYLISLGVSQDRISTISYGEEKPKDPRHNEEAWTKNRRCHFVTTTK